jgi:hypothetical protein
MLAVLITLTPGRQNKFIDCQKAKIHIVILLIMDVKSHWNSTLKLLECTYRLRKFTCDWLPNPKYSEYQPLFTTQDKWTIVMYAMEELRPFWYWTLWMSKRPTATLHHVITVYSDMFEHMDGMMGAFAKMKTQRREDLFFTLKLAWQKLSKYYAKVTPTTGMLLISAHILDSFRKLQSFRKCDKVMDINPEDETSYTTQYQEAFLKHVENEYCDKHLVLATGPGNPPAVRVWTAKTGRFGSRPVQKPDPLTLGGPNPDPYPSTRGFRRVWLDPSVPISGSAFRVSHLWSHSDMLLLIVK